MRDIEQRYQLCKVCGAKDCDCTLTDALNKIGSLRHQLEMAEACLAGDNALIVGLKNDIAEKDEEINSYKTSYESTHAQNLRLADQLGESAAEIERLKAENMKLVLDCLSADGQALEHWQQLAASQAREQQLREMFSRVARPMGEREHPNDYAAKARFTAIRALELPRDTTAIEAMIAKAGEVMRERCDSQVTTMRLEYHRNDCCLYSGNPAKAIRALPPITLKDLE